MKSYQTFNIDGIYYILTDEYLYVDHVEYKLPKFARDAKMCKATKVGDTLYINGYRFKDGKFKITPKSIWYKWF